MLRIVTFLMALSVPAPKEALFVSLGATMITAVDLHEVLRGGILGRPHLRQFQRAADHCQSSAAVDQRTDDNRLIDIRADAQAGARGCGSRFGASEKCGGGCQQTAPPKQLDRKSVV